MLRHLRQVVADERRVGVELTHFCLVEQVRTAQPPLLPQAVLGVGLQAPDPGTAEVLALLEGGDPRRRGYTGERRVGHGVTNAIVEPGRADRECRHRCHAQAQFAAPEALRPQVLIGERPRLADLELAIELVERRCPEARSDAAPDSHPVVDAVQGAGTRTEHRIAPIGERSAVAVGAGAPVERWSRCAARRSSASDRRAR
jgi:hypothetical protein